MERSWGCTNRACPCGGGTPPAGQCRRKVVVELSTHSYLVVHCQLGGYRAVAAEEGTIVQKLPSVEPLDGSINLFLGSIGVFGDW